MTHRAEQTMGGGALAFLLGVGAGAVAGLLLAPRSGRESREHIKDKVQEMRSKAEETMKEQKNMAKNRLAEAREAAAGTLHDAAGAVEETGRSGRTPRGIKTPSAP